MSYVCTKALRISGVDYAPGDAIPDGAIRPERVRAIKNIRLYWRAYRGSSTTG